MASTSTEIIGDTLIVKAKHDLREFDNKSIDSEWEDIVLVLEDPGLRNVVMDLSGTNYYGSSALNWFLRLDKRTQANGGQLILVGLSNHEKEILHITKLDGRWTVCETMAEALTICNRPVNAGHS